MSCGEWVRGPFGPDASRGRMRPAERTILVVVHHLAAATRLMDVLPLVESDLRVQVVFTCPPSSVYAHGGMEFVRQLGGVVVPWFEAKRLSFDLAVAAADGMLEQLHAPIVRLQHGMGISKIQPRWPGHGPPAPREVGALERQRLLFRGRVVPSALILPTAEQRDQLARVCTPALPAVVVAGDPTHDRLVASMPLRQDYRDRLGVEPGQKLVVVSSTWGKTSTLGQHPELLHRLVAELPREEYRVVAVLHPNIWVWYGRRQVRGWYAEPMRAGLGLVPPEEGWRAALVAADVLIGDYGSVTYHGACLQVPVLLAAEQDVVPDSQAWVLGRIAPRLDTTHRLVPQIHRAERTYDPERYRQVRRLISSMPGDAARIIRRVMYQLMNLPEPQAPVSVQPVPLPPLVDADELAGASQWHRE